MVAKKTAKNFGGLLYFAAPCMCMGFDAVGWPNEMWKCTPQVHFERPGLIWSYSRKLGV